MHCEDIIPIVITIFIIIGLGVKAVFGAPIVGTIIRATAKAVLPVLATKIAQEAANLILVPLSQRGLLPPNTTALSI